MAAGRGLTSERLGVPMRDAWTETTVADNAGRPLTVWAWRDYEIALEANEGRDKGWVYELTECRRRVGVYCALEEGMLAAEHREAGLLDSSVMVAALMDGGP